jgi:hypothetical protein
MATKKTIPGSDFFKSLGRLEALAGKGKSEDMSKAQLFHTPSDSEPASWPGGEKTELGDKWSDSIGEDGTDYHPARKAIAEKALKGIALAPEEIAILKGDIEAFMEDKKEDKKDKKDEKEEKAMPPMGGKMAFKAQKEDEDSKEDEEEDKKEMGKSFSSVASKSESIQKGIELSEFLTDVVKSFGAGLEGMEARTTNVVEQATNSMLSQLGSYLSSKFEEQAQFNKSMADAIVNIGHGVAGNIAQLDQVAQAPASAPKSQFRAIEKSFAGPQGDNFDKSQKLDAMVDLVEKGRLSSIEVCKFESTGQLSPNVDSMIINHIKGGRA